MLDDDKQVGLPEVLYKDTKSNIEAIANPVKGMCAYATDTDLVGWYTGSIWEWISDDGGGGVLSQFRCDYSANFNQSNNTWTKVPIDTVFYDTASEISTANNRIVLANDCDLIMWVQGTTGSTNTNAYAHRLYRNGAMRNWYGYHRIGTSYNQSLWSAAFMIPGQSASWYYEMYVWKWSAGYLQGNQEWITSFGGFTLSPT